MQLYYLPVGMEPVDAVDLLESKKMTELITKLSNNYDFVLFNLSPFNENTAALIIAKALGVNILVANQSLTILNEFIRTNNILDATHVNVIGTLFIASK
jgi:tyrosine-protein kinase Etk/Wzc